MELYLEPVKITKNPLNGRFLKGHAPHNKGKKWEDYMDMRKANKLKKNLLLGRLKGNPNLPGHNKKKVIGIKDGKIYCVFPSASDAQLELGIQRANISKCCRKERKKAGGIFWFFEDNVDEWADMLDY